MEDTYRPLPNTLEVKKSEIEGSGLFATEDIDSGVVLGVSHLLFDNGKVQRTPLGGFYNHSDTPNCGKILGYVNDTYSILSLVTNKMINKGDEITVKYTLYKV